MRNRQSPDREKLEAKLNKIEAIIDSADTTSIWEVTEPMSLIDIVTPDREEWEYAHRTRIYRKWKNKMKSADPTAWFLAKRPLPPSPAESKIIEILNTYEIAWYREVCFRGYAIDYEDYRVYDFYIPELKLVIEYDGEEWHSSDRNILIDRKKTNFCMDHDLRLIRFNKEHFHDLYFHIDALLSSYDLSPSNEVINKILTSP